MRPRADGNAWTLAVDDVGAGGQRSGVSGGRFIAGIAESARTSSNQPIAVGRACGRQLCNIGLGLHQACACGQAAGVDGDSAPGACGNGRQAVGHRRTATRDQKLHITARIA